MDLKIYNIFMLVGFLKSIVCYFINIYHAIIKIIFKKDEFRKEIELSI